MGNGISSGNSIESPDCMSDSIREFLRERGCGEHITSGGFVGLIEAWEQIVASIAAGYNLGLDDYLNDMDLRQLIAEALPLATPAQQQRYSARIEEADRTLKSHLLPAPACLWGEEVAEAEGWTREQNWWYFQYPENAGEDLRAELGLG